jgi:hypothetical protein
MGGAERIVFALRPLGEAGKPPALAKRADAVAAAGEDLVRIGLVADVPDEPVARRIEHIMERHGQFDHAQAGAKMAARHGHRGNRLLPQFVGNLTQLILRQPPQIGRRVNAVKYWGIRGLRHEPSS